MAKALTATSAKVSITHDRVALTVKFPDGYVLKTAVNRSSDTFKVAAPVGATSMPNVNPLWKFINAKLKGETHGERFERLAKFFEATASIEHALTVVANCRNPVNAK